MASVDIHRERGHGSVEGGRIATLDCYEDSLE